MMTVAAAVKAGAVCISLLSPDVNFCTIKGADYICTRQGCESEGEMTAEWQGHPEKQLEFYKQLYGYNEGK